MLSTTLAILLVATWGAVLVSWLKRMPSGQFCAACTNPTQSVVAPWWLRPMSRWLVVRWCALCNTQRIGRNGPDYIPGKQIAHDSGFLWADDETGENMGFRWKADEEKAPQADPPAHASGFRFGGSEAPARRRKPKAHPSGFDWGDTPEPHPAFERRKKGHPSGFAWGKPEDGARSGEDRPPPQARGFQWKSGDGPKTESDKDKPDGFKWGGVA